jgi:murein DD-endopeptidase MepM/ murein hydrolase activator NlpD
MPATFAPPLVPGTFKLGSRFGPRTHPVTGKVHWHNGLDFKGDVPGALKGDQVLACDDGVVTVVNRDPRVESGSGLYVQVTHAGGWRTSYCHLDTIAVEKGDAVLKGDKVGTVGETGVCKGAHLHLTVRRPDGRSVDPVPEIPGVLDAAFRPPPAAA